MIQLRDYQQDLLDRVQTSLVLEKARVMMQLPTGGGKTIIAGALLKEWLIHGRKAVWLTHRKELANQTCELLKDANIAAKVDTNWKPGEISQAWQNGVVILMAQTVSRRNSTMNVWHEYDDEDLMIIDEAHHASAHGWRRAMEQWPGQILGITATPWRLSQREGFDDLFGELLCGPQVADLQSNGFLCESQVQVPSQQWIIRGGEVNRAGEYTEGGIEAANRTDILTAGAFKFWQELARERQTIVYAVSVAHAHNLASVFENAGVPASVILGDTTDEVRANLLSDFKNGFLRVLVNVAVATEGFDLPDAACVVITRPTKSLTLYLQMVGRGLRPKEDGGNSLILDLAANVETHGLPEDHREWSLAPRETRMELGNAATIWCAKCKAVSPAASHSCQNCDDPFGKGCGRCGKWRAWKHWILENHCGDSHELVCDLCHRDAHIEAHLPVDEQLETKLEQLKNEKLSALTLSQFTLKSGRGETEAELKNMRVALNATVRNLLRFVEYEVPDTDGHNIEDNEDLYQANIEVYRSMKSLARLNDQLKELANDFKEAIATANYKAHLDSVAERAAGWSIVKNEDGMYEISQNNRWQGTFPPQVISRVSQALIGDAQLATELVEIASLAPEPLARSKRHH